MWVKDAYKRLLKPLLQVSYYTLPDPTGAALHPKHYPRLTIRFRVVKDSIITRNSTSNLKENHHIETGLKASNLRNELVTIKNLLWLPWWSEDWRYTDNRKCPNYWLLKLMALFQQLRRKTETNSHLYKSIFPCIALAPYNSDYFIELFVCGLIG